MSEVRYSEEFSENREESGSNATVIVDRFIKNLRETAMTDDVESFMEAQQRCFEIFIERKAEHGDHLHKTLFYHIFELFGKCERYCEAIVNNRQPSDDLLIDLSNYANMIRSYKQASGMNLISSIFKTEKK